MLRSFALGLVLATGALLGGLPPGERYTAVAAQTPSVHVAQVQPPPAGAPSVVPPSKKAPFEKLFQNPPMNPANPDVAAALAEQLAARTKVVCGLTMMQVDPNIDPKIRREIAAATAQKPNAIRQPDFKIRRIPPTVCRD